MTDTQTFVLTIKGDTSPTYTMFELFNPLRIVIDIADATLAQNISMPDMISKGPVSQVTSKLLNDHQPFTTRVEVFLAADHGYDVVRNGNDIVVSFTPKPTSSVTLQKIEITNNPTTKVFLHTSGAIPNYKEANLPHDNERPARLYIDLEGVGLGNIPQQLQVNSPSLDRVRTARRENGLRIVLDAASDDLFTYTIDQKQNGLLVSIDNPTSSTSTTTQNTKNQSFSDEFSFRGYKEDRITVDFFKTDLHNVFRFLGKKNGRNMVIEESVKGTLTLSLTNVPWDFVLDVILNLKDLQKEERYNTIVISPKSKGFTWPEKASAKLAIRSDGTGEAMSQDTISIKNRIETPKGVVEARKLIQQGDNKNKNKDYEGALADYENASSKWPENSQLAKRIAALCLVHLGQNAKAVHYAKLALKNDGKDEEAALQAAIGLANMKKNPAAKGFFDLAVSGPHPSSEALTSYAAFNEKNQNYLATLLLLTKHTELYGDNMETMLSKARIYDMQGDKAKAAKEFQSLLLSGYDIPADLKRYIQGRLSLINK